MDKIGNNVWLAITNMIFTIHSVDDPKKMAEVLLKELRWLIPFDRAMYFYKADSVDSEKNRPVTMNFEKEFIDRYCANKNRYDSTMGLKFGGNSIAYKQSDMVDREIWDKSCFYKEIFEPNGIKYMAEIVLCYNNHYCGFIMLFRNGNSINSTDFSDKDMFILNLLKDHLALAIARINNVDNATEVKVIEQIRRQDERRMANKMVLGEYILKYHLTERETQIMQHILDGYSTEDICSELCITINTLKKHTFNLYKKLGVNNRTQLFRTIQMAGDMSKEKIV